jgi:hypothetical protein
MMRSTDEELAAVIGLWAVGLATVGLVCLGFLVARWWWGGL